MKVKLKIENMKKILAVLLLTITTNAQSQENGFDINQIFPIERSHSFIGFSIKYMGYAQVRGRFEQFNGSFRYDEKDVSKTSVSLSIDVNSIDTDLDFRDKDLRSDQWFDVEKFPNITFTSSKAVQTDNGFNLTGNLTIKETTKEVSIAMSPASGVLTDTRGDAQVIFGGKLTLNRKDFGVTGERWSKLKEGITAVADEVAIEFTILGKQIKARNFSNWVRNTDRPQGMLYKTINDEGIDAAFKQFDALKADPESKLNANALNIAGYMLLKENRLGEALQVFRKNMDAFPEDANVYDSYAEALARNNDIVNAIIYYQKVIEMKPDNINVKEVLRHLE